MLRRIKLARWRTAKFTPESNLCGQGGKPSGAQLWQARALLPKNIFVIVKRASLFITEESVL